MRSTLISKEISFENPNNVAVQILILLFVNRRQRQLTVDTRKRMTDQAAGTEKEVDHASDPPDDKQDESKNTNGKKKKKKLTRRRLLRKADADIYEILRLDEQRRVSTVLVWGRRPWQEERRTIARFFVQDLLLGQPTPAAEKKQLKEWNHHSRDAKTKRLLEYLVRFRGSGDGPPAVFTERGRVPGPAAVKVVVANQQDDNELPDIAPKILVQVAQVTEQPPPEETAAYRRARRPQQQLEQEARDRQIAEQLAQEQEPLAEAELKRVHYKDKLYKAQEDARSKQQQNEHENDGQDRPSTRAKARRAAAAAARRTRRMMRKRRTTAIPKTSPSQMEQTPRTRRTMLDATAMTTRTKRRTRR